jgi:hypothetical protein
MDAISPHDEVEDPARSIGQSDTHPCCILLERGDGRPKLYRDMRFDGLVKEPDKVAMQDADPARDQRSTKGRQ